MSTMDIWYAHLAEDDIMALRSEPPQCGQAPRPEEQSREDREGREDRARTGQGREEQREKSLRKAHTRDSLQALSKLAEQVDGQVPDRQPTTDGRAVAGARRRPTACPRTRSNRSVRDQFRAYRATLQDDRRHLLERFEIVDIARKVVGVGSVGTRAFIVLLQGRDEQDPLFLQVKEATASVLEDHLPRSRYTQPGERVVQGQRMMQAASDIFLGWTKGARPTGTSTGANCGT